MPQQFGMYGGGQQGQQYGLKQPTLTQSYKDPNTGVKISLSRPVMEGEGRQAPGQGMGIGQQPMFGQSAMRPMMGGTRPMAGGFRPPPRGMGQGGMRQYPTPSNMGRRMPYFGRGQGQGFGRRMSPFGM